MPARFSRGGLVPRRGDFERAGIPIAASRPVNRRERALVPSGARGNDTIAPVAHNSGLRRLEAGALITAALAYFAISCGIAQVRLLWHDEIFTRQVAQFGSWNRITAALHHGIDLQPPFFYWMTAWTSSIGGEEIGLRLPAISGFTFAGVALYLVARRWFSPGYAIGAALTPAIFFFGALGMEARPYGFVMGCAALALLGWTFRDRWPRGGTIGYLAGMLGAAATHYYGFLIAAPFGAAAAWTLFRRRRWDLWTLGGCVCAALPDLWNLRLIRDGIALYKNGWWIRPSWRALANSIYGGSLAVLCAVLLIFAFSRGRRKEAFFDEGSPSGESLACWAGFSAIPILAMFLARATSGMFVLRYFSMFSLGYALLAAFAVERSVNRSRWFGYAVGCGAVVVFASVAVANERRFETEREVISALCDHFADLTERTEFRDSSFLVGDAHVALQLALYCDDIHDKLVFAPDPPLALAYVGTDATNKAMLFLRENPPLRIEPLDEFLNAQRSKLLIYHSQPSFLRDYLFHDQAYAARIHLLEAGSTAAIYVMDPAPAAGARGGEK